MMCPTSAIRVLYISTVIFNLQLLDNVHGTSEIPPPAAAIFVTEAEISASYDSSANVTESLDEKDSNYELHKILLNDIVNTDVEVMPGKRIDLECNANKPVQWSYRGSGKPEFSTSVVTEVINNREVHKATLTTLNANEKDTGLYICNYAEFPRIASTYQVFIPGTELFISEAGRTITFSSETSTVTIPCPVSVRRAKVVLRKVYYDNSLRNIDPPIAFFDPKFGFKLNIRDLRDSDGTYVCSAYHDGMLKLREYTLRNEQRNHSSVTFPEGMQDDINPCLSYFCPGGTICRVNLNTNLPFCACRPKTSSTTTNCTRLCKSSHECPKTEKCQFNVEKQLKLCTHVCEDHPCSENAECYVDEQRGSPKCRCRRGFQGTGNNDCVRIPFANVDAQGNSYCSSTKCGPNARCQNVAGKVQCVCHVGHFGNWPNCEKACTQDSDCDLQHKCSVEKGVCEHVCNDNMCAPKAECKVLHRKPMCLCPPGYTGKATEACYRSHYYFVSRSGLPAADAGVDVVEMETTTVNYENDDVQDYENLALKLSLPVSVEEETTTPSSTQLKFEER